MTEEFKEDTLPRAARRRQLKAVKKHQQFAKSKFDMDNVSGGYFEPIKHNDRPTLKDGGTRPFTPKELHERALARHAQGSSALGQMALLKIGPFQYMRKKKVNPGRTRQKLRAKELYEHNLRRDAIVGTDPKYLLRQPKTVNRSKPYKERRKEYDKQNPFVFSLERPAGE